MQIAIVGAGPAGCHLAYRLAGKDYKILLFDPRAPYEKPCGGGLSPLIGRYLPDVMALPFPRHCPRRLLLRISDGSQVGQMSERPAWTIVSRADFGQALLERAIDRKVIRFIRQRVVKVKRTNKRWSIYTAGGQVFLAEFLIGADGVRSVVRRCVVGPIPRQHLSLTVGYFVQGAPDILVFQTFSDLEGYFWLFPRINHASVGVGSRWGVEPPQNLWQRLDRSLYDVCPKARKEKRWAALLPVAKDLTLWNTPCVGRGWALLGDAAGHVNPLTGEGITYALWGAELLFQAFIEGEPLVYEELWRAHYGQEFVRAIELLQQQNTPLNKGGYETLFCKWLITNIIKNT